jgi:Lon protease-like protein
MGSVPERLALFPLRTVLFPGMVLPLHVFEPRYRKLVHDCVEGNQPFGIALIRSGEEVGEAAEPRDLGCTARIVAARAFPDGRSFLLVRGERRFAIETVAQDEEPYLIAYVTWLEEPEGDEAVGLVEHAREAFGAYRLAVTSVGTQRHAEASAEPQSSEPNALSYEIASGLAVDAEERQRLLEAATAAQRLAAEVQILERENALLREILVRQHARGEGPRPN